MAKDIRFGLMVAFMKDIGKMIRLMEKEDLFMLMEMSMRGIGWMIRLMAMAHILIQMEQHMWVTGSMISKKDKEKKIGLMVLLMKVTIKRG